MKTYVKNLIGLVVVSAAISYFPLHDAFLTWRGVSDLLKDAGLPTSGLSIHRTWYYRGGAFDVPVNRQQFDDFASHYNLFEIPSSDSDLVFGKLETMGVPVRYSDKVDTQFFRAKNVVALPGASGAIIVNVGYSPDQHRMFVIFYWPYG